MTNFHLKLKIYKVTRYYLSKFNIKNNKKIIKVL